MIEIVKNKKVILIAVAFLMVVSFVGYEFFWNGANKSCVVDLATQEDIQTFPEEKPETIEVYIVGCVKNPGTYEVAKDTTIKKLSEIAGGFTEGADLEKINLVYKLKDNAMIVIKDKNEQSKQQEESGMKIIKGVYEEYEDDNLQVNINTAGKDTLTKLPGIGESVAKKIIKYRENNGGFDDVEDLMNIPGIGESKFNSIKDMIVIG